MASVLGLPEQKCEIIIKSIIQILKPRVMPYSKQQKNLKNFHICHFGLIEGKSLKLAKVVCELAQNRAQIFRVPGGTLYAHEISLVKSCTIYPLEAAKI